MAGTGNALRSSLAGNTVGASRRGCLLEDGAFLGSRCQAQWQHGRLVAWPIGDEWREEKKSGDRARRAQAAGLLREENGDFALSSACGSGLGWH
jgi:hypothetical protein